MASSARRALTNVGGNVELCRGRLQDQELLKAALHVRADDPYARSHVHGFHAYPARLHPVTAQRLVKGLARPGDSVLDPFCGSGTVLVEAQIERRRAAGVDANPLAVMLSSYKLQRMRQSECERLVADAKLVAESAEARRTGRVGPSKRYPANQACQFDPHVLLELDGLITAIAKLADAQSKAGLRLVLSSIINKFSRQTSDTAARPSQRRVAAGFVIRFFLGKAEELARRQAEFAKLLPTRSAQDFDIRLGDARELPYRNRSIEAIISSPPYPGVYDYIEHHRLRLQWLGLDARFLDRHEIGARRQNRTNNSLRNEYNTQLLQCLNEMARVLRPGGTIALVVADSVVDAKAWYADEEIESLAETAGLWLAAAAAQIRPHFHRATGHAFGRRPRSERLLLLRRK